MTEYTGKTNQRQVFENLPVSSALRTMIVPAVISQLPGEELCSPPFYAKLKKI